MELRYLSDIFYNKYQDCSEILIKKNRPYIILIIEIDNLKFAIPFRSSMNIHKKYCYITNKEKKSGLDFEKSIPIFDDSWLSTKNYPTINQYEFNYIKFEEYKIKHMFTNFLKAYKKDFYKRKESPDIPQNKDFIFCTLKYFHRELGLE